jgi:hypothetical protein
MSDTPLQSNPFNNPEMSYDTPSDQTPYFTPRTGKTPTRISSRKPGAVNVKKPSGVSKPKSNSKSCKKVVNAVKAQTSDAIKAALSETASIHNTLIVGSSMYNRFFGNISPKELVFVYYDDPKKWPDPEYVPTINGYTLQEINEGLCKEDLVEYKVVTKKHTFDKDHKNIDVVAVEYEDETGKVKQYKVKYAGLKPNKQPYFFTEYALDAIRDPQGGIRYYGEFLSAQGVDAAQAMNAFGKRSKKGSKTLHIELKYLLSLK